MKGSGKMKKYAVLFLILICLSFNILIATPAFAVINFKEGVYQLSDFNISPNNRYTIKNISIRDSVYVVLFDENQRQIQALILSPKSENYNLLALKPNYRIAIIGNGEVTID